MGLRFGVGFCGFENVGCWFFPLSVVLSTGQKWFLSAAARFPYLSKSASKISVNSLLLSVQRKLTGDLSS